MIYDHFDNLALYAAPGTLLYKALVYARDVAADVPDGRIEIDGEHLYASVASYETGTRDERRFEAHRRYIDIQVLLAGEEAVDVTLERDLPPLEVYDPQRDVMFLKPPAHAATLPLRPGWFAVFYPHDVHRPGCHLEGKRAVRKIVMKVAGSERPRTA